ncbi:amino acid deaminase [Microbacterium sp. NPDC089320]|uniref:amino acid deaminase n=1 Tax=Microbacterium sp. NPDC089320 TaxID=3155182 RepID=UPI003433D601
MSELDELTDAAAVAMGGTAADARAAIDALPWLDESIAQDREAGRFRTWGRSTIVDENTARHLVPRALFDELHARAGRHAVWPIGDAGLLHCYGYLLSLEPTPYGLKRDRWIHGALAEACGLSSDAFTPWRGGETLLARATTAASALMRSPAATASHLLDGREARVSFSSAEGPAALAYAVASTPGAAPLLVTTFPVADASTQLADFIADPRLRWNAA